jgi:hypothetical protein
MFRFALTRLVQNNVRMGLSERERTELQAVLRPDRYDEGSDQDVGIGAAPVQQRVDREGMP